MLWSGKTINEHLYFYSALVRGRRNPECHHIANASTLAASLFDTNQNDTVTAFIEKIISQMFTYNVQLAGYPFEKCDEKGETNFTDFILTLDTFPWLDQVDNYDRIKEGCSATISVKAVGEESAFWVSIAGDRQKFVFLVGYVYLKNKKGFFGFGKEKSIKWVDIYEIEDKDRIKSLFKLFFDQNIDKLKSELLTLKKFDSMKAYIQ